MPARATRVDAYYHRRMKMTRLERFYAAALGNSQICSGKAHSSDLDRWFGPHAVNIRGEQIAARQALDYALEAEKLYGQVFGGSLD